MSRPQLKPGDELVPLHWREEFADTWLVWRVTHVQPQALFPTEEHVWVRLVYVTKPEEKA